MIVETKGKVGHPLEISIKRVTLLKEAKLAHIEIRVNGRCEGE